MKKTFPLVGALTALLCSFATATATDFVDGPYNFNYGPTPQSFDPKNVPITLPKFNSQGGNRLLKRVDVSVTAGAFLSISIENNLTGARSVTPSVTGSLTIDFPQGLFQDSDNVVINLPQVNLQGTNGVICAGPDFFDFGDRTIGPELFSTQFFGNPTTLAAFIGPGNLTGDADVSINGNAGGPAFAFNLEGPRNGGAPCVNTSPQIQVTASVTYYYGLATGACCLPGGACVQTDAADCANRGGAYSGNGTNCASVVCPRACCLPSGACVVLTPADCTAQNGVIRDIGITCATANCPQPGACCVPSPGTGPACVVVLPAACSALNGNFLGAGTNCSNAPCPGACCLPGGSCVSVTQASCTQQNGTFSGAGVPCAAANCPRACCLPDENCQVLTAAQCASAQGTLQAIGVTCANANCRVGVCDCYWENGDADDANAIASERNTSVPESTAADDFIIPAAKILIGREFCGCMVTNDLERVQGNIVDRPEAVLALYEDCNGKPGALLTEFNEETYQILGNAPFGSPGQYKYVKFCFDLDGFRLEAVNSERRVWVSLIGVGDGLLGPGERYFWATSKTVADGGPSDEIQGVQAQLKSTWIEGFEDWRDVEDTNGQCHDLCFDYCGDLCDVVCNNTPFALDCGAKMLNTTFFGTKAADNFQIQPCASVDVCLIQAWIATNCTPSRSILEVRGNECDTPTSPAIRVLQNPTVVPALNVQGNPIFFNSPVSGIPLQVYCLEWEFEAGAFSLTGGENYWISVFLNGTGVITEEAYFLCKQRTACNLKITEAQYISAPFAINDWEPISLLIGTPSDLAFRILGNIRLDNEELLAPSSSGLADPGVPGPQRDLNGDGTVDAKDIEQMLRLMSVGSAN